MQKNFMELEAHVTGRNFRDIKPVLKFLCRENIPVMFRIVKNYNQEPVCEIDGYRHYGIRHLEKIKKAYEFKTYFNNSS